MDAREKKRQSACHYFQSIHDKSFSKIEFSDPKSTSRCLDWVGTNPSTDLIRQTSMQRLDSVTPFLEFHVGMPSMFRQILRRHGITKTSVGLTLISIFLSVVITRGINFFLSGSPPGDGLVIAILVPAIIAPVMSLQMLRLLHDLDQAAEKLKILSYTDELTQTHNRRYFIQFGEQELRRAQRYGEAFTIVLLDIDNFKEINDTGGHLIGDKVLRNLSDLLKKRFVSPMSSRATGAMNLFSCFQKQINGKR